MRHVPALRAAYAVVAKVTPDSSCCWANGGSEAFGGSRYRLREQLWAGTVSVVANGWPGVKNEGPES